MQHGGRRNGHLGCAALGNLRLQVVEVGELYIFHMAHFVDHADNGWRQFLGAIGSLDGDRDVGFHATHLLQKIDVEIGATEFAISDGLEAYVFLELHDLGDGFVFHHPQLFGGDMALGLLFAGFQEVSGP